MSENNLPVQQVQKNITEKVLDRVKAYQAEGDLVLPKNYSPENALKSAYLVLMETTNNKGENVLKEGVCTKASIANALLDMIVQGLNPMKGQCAFVVYGNKLTMQREYHGTVALAKRVGGVTGVHGQVIYEGDKFSYTIDPSTGKKVITEHIQELDNVDPAKIKGAYAVVALNDGTTDVEVMTMAQIRQAWLMGATKGQSPAHRNFPDQMSIKTAIQRACKLYITTSSDSSLYDKSDEQGDVKQITSRREALDNSGLEPLSLDSIEDSDYEEIPDENPPQEENPPQKPKGYKRESINPDVKEEPKEEPQKAKEKKKEEPHPEKKEDKTPDATPPSWINPAGSGTGSPTLFGDQK